MSYNIDLYFDINENVTTVDFESILKLDKLKYIKDKIDNIKNLTSKYGLDVCFEDYDIVKEKNNYVAKYKNIGVIIENDIINFIKEIKQNYSISLITNNNTEKIIYKYNRYKNINNSDKTNIKTELDQEMYDLVTIN
jgi:AAA+ ATPase superfamily predicted ATPase